ncbi:hypothetical protein EDEG_04065 [Edhazardia aedis USNM 41457]|uniref:Uncharacterized protein n=1 Tax=Edhazardia aedis (strain USNM 41457) TaxID=1003232 RepID=J9DIK1_EDHAE|nr:hypothetical protein EDEG_04065 [Edhazardia aedis USNM 41457]|eukprot:EJW01192.1 hypothetical protein EDEG_04065 [Edhazardia aedis USNM 41457]
MKLDEIIYVAYFFVIIVQSKPQKKISSCESKREFNNIHKMQLRSHTKHFLKDNPVLHLENSCKIMKKSCDEKLKPQSEPKRDGKHDEGEIKTSSSQLEISDFKHEPQSDEKVIPLRKSSFSSKQLNTRKRIVKKPELKNSSETSTSVLKFLLLKKYKDTDIISPKSSASFLQSSQRLEKIHNNVKNDKTDCHMSKSMLNSFANLQKKFEKLRISDGKYCRRQIKCKSKNRNFISCCDKEFEEDSTIEHKKKHRSSQNYKCNDTIESIKCYENKNVVNEQIIQNDSETKLFPQSLNDKNEENPFQIPKNDSIFVMLDQYMDNRQNNITKSSFFQTLDLSDRIKQNKNIDSSDNGILTHKINHLNYAHFDQNSSYTSNTEEEPTPENLIASLVDKFYCNPNTTPTLLNSFIDKNASFYTDMQQNTNNNLEYSFCAVSTVEICKDNGLIIYPHSDETPHCFSQENSSFVAIQQIKNDENTNIHRINVTENKTDDLKSHRNVFSEHDCTRFCENSITNGDFPACKNQRTSENTAQFNQEIHNHLNIEYFQQPEQNYFIIDPRYNLQNNYLDISTKEEFYDQEISDKKDLKVNEFSNSNIQNSNPLDKNIITKTLQKQQSDTEQNQTINLPNYNRPSVIIFNTNHKRKNLSASVSTQFQSKDNYNTKNIPSYSDLSRNNNRKFLNNEDKIENSSKNPSSINQSGNNCAVYNQIRSERDGKDDFEIVDANLQPSDCRTGKNANLSTNIIQEDQTNYSNPPILCFIQENNGSNFNIKDIEYQICSMTESVNKIVPLQSIKGNIVNGKKHFEQDEEEKQKEVNDEHLPEDLNADEIIASINLESYYNLEEGNMVCGNSDVKENEQIYKSDVKETGVEFFDELNYPEKGYYDMKSEKNNSLIEKKLKKFEISCNKNVNAADNSVSLPSFENTFSNFIHKKQKQNHDI